MGRMIAAAVVAALITGCAEHEPDPASEVPITPTPEELEQDRIEEKLAKIRGLLIDGDSAKFRNVKFSEHELLHKETLCGEVNSKNVYGGYTGWQIFSLSYSSGAPDVQAIFMYHPDADSIDNDLARSNISLSGCSTRLSAEEEGI